MKAIKELMKSFYRYTLSYFLNPFLDEETEDEFKAKFIERVNDKIQLM